MKSYIALKLNIANDDEVKKLMDQKLKNIDHTLAYLKDK